MIANQATDGKEIFLKFTVYNASLVPHENHRGDRIREYRTWTRRCGILKAVFFLGPEDRFPETAKLS